MMEHPKLSRANLLLNVSYFRYRQESPRVKFKLLTATSAESGEIRKAPSHIAAAKF